MSLKFRDPEGNEQTIAGTPYDTLKELGDKLDALQTYSTDEINTGKTWIDGKPIYRKVYSFTTAAGSAGASTTVPSGVSDMGHIISVNGYVDVTNGTDYFQMPIQWVHSSGIYVGVYYNYTGQNFTVSTGRSYENGRPAALIVEYTKTTD